MHMLLDMLGQWLALQRLVTGLRARAATSRCKQARALGCLFRSGQLAARLKLRADFRSGNTEAYYIVRVTPMMLATGTDSAAAALVETQL